jgi:xylulokinase
VLDRPLDVTVEGDTGGAFGAARLGRVADTGADPFETLTPPMVARTVEPVRALVPAYAERYARYRALWPAIRDAS